MLYDKMCLQGTGAMTGCSDQTACARTCSLVGASVVITCGNISNVISFGSQVLSVVGLDISHSYNEERCGFVMTWLKLVLLYQKDNAFVGLFKRDYWICLTLKVGLLT